MTLTPMRKSLEPSRIHLFADIHTSGGNADDSDSEGMELLSSFSPPRTARKQQLPSARLFFGGDDTGTDVASLDEMDMKSNGKTPKRKSDFAAAPRHRSAQSTSGDSCVSDLSNDNDNDNSSVLRPVDMNMSMHMNGMQIAGTPQSQQKRKQHHYQDSDDDVYMSPHHHSLSPAEYRTLDGRTVKSKNPFSPFTPNMTSDESGQSGAIHSAPSFPMTLESHASHLPKETATVTSENTAARFTSNSDLGQSPPHASKPPQHLSGGPSRISKINLQRRDTGQARHQLQPNSADLNQPVGQGYPDRQGQYSFTGSPIEEIDIFESSEREIGHKVRRLNLNDDASTQSHHRPALFVDTEQANHNDSEKIGLFQDKISPTDIMSFPAPSPPSKPLKHRYTPLSNAAPPQTPMAERRHGGRTTYRGEEADDMLQSRPPKSRFNLDFDIISQLGDGSFGTVYKCLSRLDGCMYAIKAAKRKAKGAADLGRMLKEVYALAALSDQADTAAFHIVRYHQAWMEDDRLYIQTELCSNTLQHEMRNGMLSEQRRYKLLREMLLALEFIHRNGMVHLDIKPENIFIKNDQFKLGDFGLVSKISNHDVEEGDSRYMSKELLSGDHDDLTKSDIFSLGATMYETCLGGRPLPTDGPEWQNMRSGIFAPLQNTLPEMEHIIKQMMDPDLHSRPKASDLLKRRQLLSVEQKQLMKERSNVFEAKLALAQQAQKMKNMPPAPRPKGLQRANTWNGGF